MIIIIIITIMIIKLVPSKSGHLSDCLYQTRGGKYFGSWCEDGYIL